MIIPGIVRLIPLLFLCVVGSVNAFDIERDDINAFIDQMVSEHNYDRAALEMVLADAKPQQKILDAIARPAERTKEWHEYRDIFVTDKRISAGADFWREHEKELERISKESGVSIEILVGIIGVETYFGRITGGYRVIDALSTLAFNYPPRSKFFRSELEQFLLLVREEDMQVEDATGSYAGAMGAPQFMPSSYRAYAVDSSDDGKRDIWNNWSDVIGSVANYFVKHKWRAQTQVVAEASLSRPWEGKKPENILKPAETVSSLSEQGVMFATDLPGDARTQLIRLQGEGGEEYWVAFHNFFVITRYNRSVMYALAVHQLGQKIAYEVRRGGS